MSNFEQETSSNGVDSLYDKSNYSDYTTVKPRSGSNKRLILFDATAMLMLTAYLLGLLPKITDIPHFMTWLVVLAYLIARTILIWSKLFAFLGKNWLWIKKGWTQVWSRFNDEK